jgi:RNA polymerase sigma factor (sigma-70 family)
LLRPDADGELLAASAGGDLRAFRALYDRHARSVFQYCLSICRDQSGAEDASQEVWTTLWRTRKRTQFASGSALAWLLVTARHKSLNWLRASSRQPSTQSASIELTDASGDPAAKIQLADLQAHIEALINELPDIDRKIFALCAQSGHRYASAADTLGVSENVVRNRLSRLRIRLRASITDYGASQ